MVYPHVEIAGTAVKGKCRVNLHTCEDDLETLYKGPIEEKAIKAVLEPILKEYPNIRVRTMDLAPDTKGYLHIFRVHEGGETIRAFGRTHVECPNPFKNRKVYAMTNPNNSVGFDTVEL
jgi:hypothetical protein